MNFLLTAFLFLFQNVVRTPNNANVQVQEQPYDTFGGSWLWFVLAVVLVAGVFFWAYKKGMLSWLPGFKVKPKGVHKVDPPIPSDEPPTGPRVV